MNTPSTPGIEINPAVAFAMISRMIGGGDGRAVSVERALADIEQNVIEGDDVVSRTAEWLLPLTWSPYAA